MSKWVPHLPRARWKRWLLLAFAACVVAVLGFVNLALTGVLLWQNPKNQSWVMLNILRHQIRQPAETPPPAHLSPGEAALLRTQAADLQSAAQLFQSTNIWDVQLRFSSNQWAALGPNAVAPVFHFLQPDGSVILRNPQATRNGLAGVFGLDFPWSSAEVSFGDAHFLNLAIRFKGNGTFVNSQRSYKRPFKIDLNKSIKGRRLAGVKTLNLHNLTADASCLSDTLAYEFFRQAGVPAARTAFARLRLSIDGRFADRLLGLYVLVENPDETWARAQFGTEGVALFKPVTYELFKDLGEDWTAYEGIYDPKTKLKPKQIRRLIDLAKLMTHAADDEFAGRIGEFIDVDEFATFLAGQAILSNYDGPLSNGQNFLLYLDPRNDRFGFIPWDLDQCWGDFGFIGSNKQREEASLAHPWVGKNRFLERMLQVPAVQAAYRRELERLRATLFIPERLNQRLDELIRVVRPFVAEESPGRLARFERMVGREQDFNEAGHDPANSGKRGFSMRHFFAARAAAVTAQLQGDEQGVILSRRSRN
ncbi:MAG TPA: CotH kinase family protein [Verrucomicrobiae bacterium]|nr:CotH kinase family protein [Verrucomicrobiae bacterium]